MVAPSGAQPSVATGRAAAWALALAVAGAGLGARLGGGPAAGRPSASATAEVEVGGRFVKGPLEPPDIATARLEGAVLAADPSVEVRAHVMPGPGRLRLRLDVAAETSSAATAALTQGAQAVLRRYAAWHAGEIEGQRRVHGRLSKLGARLATASFDADRAAQEDLNRQRLNGTRLVLEALDGARPEGPLAAATAAGAGPGSARGAALGGVIGLWLGLVLLGGARLGASAGRRRAAAVASGLLGIAGLHQASNAPPAWQGQAVLRIARADGRTLPANPPAARKVERWVAAEIRAGRLPYGVRFRTLGAPAATGRFELRASGADPDAVRRVLRVAAEHVEAWHVLGMKTTRRGLEGAAGEARRELDAALAAATDGPAFEAASDAILALAAAERALSPLRTADSERLLGPRLAAPPRGGHRAAYLGVGLLAGPLLAGLLFGLREALR